MQITAGGEDGNPFEGGILLLFKYIYEGLNIGKKQGNIPIEKKEQFAALNLEMIVKLESVLSKHREIINELVAKYSGQ
jgi:hypothetical protein